MAKEYQMAFSIGAKVQSQFGAAFKSAQSSVVALQSKIESLNKQQGNITAYQKTQQAIEKTRAKLQLYQQQYANLKAEMDKSGEASASMKNQLLAKGKAISDNSKKLAEQESRLNTYGQSLNAAGIDTNNLAKESENLAAELSSLKAEQENAAQGAEEMGQSMADSASAIAEVVAAAGLMKVFQVGVQALKECSEAAIEYESAMAGVKRTVGGSDAFLQGLGESFKNLSTEIPISAGELAGIATTAGQLGIAQENVESFTTVMAQLATTTDLSADSAATMLAQFSNITGVTDYERLGSVVADLGDATATTASKVVEMSQGMAASASQAGMSSVDILGISAALGSLGIEAQAGSTSMSTLISTLYKAVETGDGLTEFASVANMTADQFKRAWGENAVGAMDAFIQGLNDTERNGKSAIVILDELGITNVRQTKAILGLASAGSLLSNTINQAGNAWNQNTALAAKASVMYETTEAKLAMLGNGFNNLKIAVGDAFTPIIGGAASALTDLMQPVTSFIQKNPALVRAFTAAAAVVGITAVAVTGYAAAMRVATKAQALFTATIPGLNIVMGIAAGLAAVTAGVILLVEAFKNGQQSMEELDAEFDDLNADFKKQSNIRSLCTEYKQLQNELLNTKNGFTGLENQDDITVTITASALASLIPEDFMDPDAEGIKLTAEQIANLVASGFMLKDDEGITLTAQQTADLVASGFLKPDDKGIQLKAGQVAELVASGFMKPDDEGITLKAGQTADLLAKGFLNPNDEGITLTAGQMAELKAQGFMNPGDEGITLKAGQTADLKEAGFMAAEDEGITLTAQQTADLVALGFMSPDDQGITLKAGQTAELLAAGFLNPEDEGITLKAGQTADLLASGFMKPEDDGIILKATQASDLTAAGFMIDPEEKISISGSAVKDLEAKGFLKGSDILEIKGIADKTTKITVDDYIAASDRVVELTANVTNLEDVQKAIASLQEEAKALKGDTATAKKDLDQANKDLAAMEQRQSELEARLTHAGTESAKSAIQQAIEDQTAAVEAQRAKVAELEAAYASNVTQYAITQAAADELAAKEQRLSEIKSELADASDAVSSSLAGETRSMDEQIERADQIAKGEQARLRSEIYENATKQAQKYAEAVQKEVKIHSESDGWVDVYDRSLKYAGKSTDELAASMASLFEQYDSMTQFGEQLDEYWGTMEKVPEFDYTSSIQDMEDEIFALGYLMGHVLDLGQYTGNGLDWREHIDVDGLTATEATVLYYTAELSRRTGEYGTQIQEVNELQQLFIENLASGVESGVLSADEAFQLLSSSLTTAGMTEERIAEATEELSQAMGLATDEANGMADGMEEIGASAAEVNAAMQPILDKMTQLSEAYTEAYDAAYKSMDGQFKLFEEAPELTQQSVDQMIAALQSQAVYMQEYTANLKAAGEMGLSQGLIAQLSDGSKESAAYLAAIVSDGATKIDELNTAFSSVEEGKAEFANTVAEMETDFSAQMAALQADLETAVSQMNMSSEAASAGAATVQAFADAAAGNVDAVTAAFRAVSKAAKLALKVDLNPDGYASGTESAERGFRWVGERGPELMWFNGGEQVMNAQDSRNFMRQATSAEPVQAISDRSGGSHYNIEVKPEFNITGSSNPAETEALMQQQTERMRDMIEQVFDDIESDRARRVYTR